MSLRKIATSLLPLIAAFLFPEGIAFANVLNDNPSFLCSPVSVVRDESSRVNTFLSIENDIASFGYRDGGKAITFNWLKPLPSEGAWLGNLFLRAENFEMEWRWGSPKERIKLIESHWIQNGSCAMLSLNYDVDGQELAMHISARMQGRAMVLHIQSEKALLSGFDVGGWEREGEVKKIRPPFSPYDIYYFKKPDLFSSTFFDWTASHASGQDESLAIYDALSEGGRNALDEKFVIIVSRNIDDTFPRVPNEPSLYRKEVAGRTVIDVWTRDFNKISKDLKNLGTYGLRDCVVLIHVWQHYGFDIGLPTHYPAWEKLGGESGLQNAIQSGKDLDCYVALHENYMMMHPESPLFNEKYLSRSASGGRVEAFYNEYSKKWAYSTRPDAMIKVASMQSPVIHERYGTNAAFLDVNSSRLAWADVDMNERGQNAGQYRSYNEYRKLLWDYLQSTHKGPIFGEGGWGQFFWSGHVDGVEAQTFLDPRGSGPDLPLFVDFNLKEIHPLQVNHGMGYYERWSGDRDDAFDPVLSDAYKMQQVIFGHAPFLDTKTWFFPAYMLIQQELIGAIAKRTNLSNVESIEYEVDGRWVNSSAAARFAEWRRVKIVYDNGVEIVGNGSNEPMIYKGNLLPKYGWVAEGGGVMAYTAVKEGLVADYAETENSIFANARARDDFPMSKNGIGSGASFARLNLDGKIIDFGALKTNGTLAIHKSKSSNWELVPLNRHRDFYISMKIDKIPMPKIISYETVDGMRGTSRPKMESEKYWHLELTKGAIRYNW